MDLNYIFGSFFKTIIILKLFLFKSNNRKRKRLFNNVLSEDEPCMMMIKTGQQISESFQSL